MPEPKFKVGDIVKYRHSATVRWKILAVRPDRADDRCYYDVVSVHGMTPNYKGVVADNDTELVESNLDTPAEPSKAPQVLCKYVHGKAVPVEPVSERLYNMGVKNRSNMGDAVIAASVERDSLRLRTVQRAQRGITSMPVCNVTGQPVSIVGVIVRNIKMKGTGKTTCEAQFKCAACAENYDSGEVV
jgi:hypothetical protein